MNFSIGLDIGGTKIAGAVFDADGVEVAQVVLPTPRDYEGFLETCRSVVGQLEDVSAKGSSIGACAPYADAAVNANMPFLIGKPYHQDLERLFQRPVAWANDANCAALAEAIDGAGAGHRSVFGLSLGTGVGGGFVFDRQIIAGPNNLCGEIGHLPLPYYEDSDGARVSCGCGQTGCIEKLICGAALARLYHSLTGNAADARQIADQARQGDRDALRVLDRYFTVVAKAMVVVLHSFDPDIIVVSGGLNSLPGLYDGVPKRWGTYAVNKNPVTQFVPAQHGAMAGLRGAAWLGRQTK